MAVADYSTRIYTTGTSTAMVGEAMTLSGGNAIAQVTNTAKRIIDPTQAITFKDNAVSQAAADYTLNHLFAKVTKVTGAWTGPATIDANYLPLIELDECVSRGADLMRDVLDKTPFSADNWRKRMSGLKSAKIDLKVIAAPNKDYDAGAGTVKLETILTDGTMKVVQFTFPSGLIFRCWVFEGSITRKDEVSGRIEMDVSFESTGVFDSDNQNGSAFAFSDE